MGLNLLSVIARTLSPALIAVWLVLSLGLILLRSKNVIATLPFSGVKKVEFGPTFGGTWVIEPAMLAMLFVMGAAVWHQVTGEFIPFGQAWLSAIVMGCAFSLLFVVFINLHERTSIRLSIFLLVVFAIPCSIFFALVFFALPRIVRWELGLLGM